MRLKKGIIGLISDTHGLVRPQALAALQGVELIVHAGDIGKPEVLDSLTGVAPVAAIRGNNDRQAWARKFPEVLNLYVNGIRLQVIHNLNELEIDPAANSIHAVISGHSHKPVVMIKSDVLFVNPGSAGPRRFTLPVAVAKVLLRGGTLQAKIIELKI